MMMPSMSDTVVCFDLDDTLYKEVEYLESAFMEVAGYAASQCGGCSVSLNVMAIKGYKAMLTARQRGEDAFGALNKSLGTNIPKEDFLEIYRTHVPDIHLDNDVAEVLDELKNRGVVLSLITDGRSVQQRHKIEALGLERWFSNEDIIISEEFDSEKTDERNFRYFMDRYPNCKYIYVGDNPAKDFIAANRLGWKTVCLLDDGRNIHKQTEVAEECQPKITMQSIEEILAFIR